MLYAKDDGRGTKISVRKTSKSCEKRWMSDLRQMQSSVDEA